MKHPKVEIYQEAAKPTLSESDPPLEWRWRLKAANGEIVASGESYGSPRDAERGFRAAAVAVIEISAIAAREGWMPLRTVAVVVTEKEA